MGFVKLPYSDVVNKMNDNKPATMYVPHFDDADNIDYIEAFNKKNRLIARIFESPKIYTIISAKDLDQDEVMRINAERQMIDIPARFSVQFEELRYPKNQPKVRMIYDGKQVGKDQKNFTQSKDNVSRYVHVFPVVAQAVMGESSSLQAIIQNKRPLLEDDHPLRPAVQAEQHIQLILLALYKDNAAMKEGKPTDGLVTMLQETAKQSRAQLWRDATQENWAQLVSQFYINLDKVAAHKGGTLICDSSARSVEYIF